MNKEKIFEFKKFYIQLNIQMMFGLGLSINNTGLIIIVGCFYVGFHVR